MADRQVLEARFPTGTLLAGRYEIRSVLGQGGMAEVYLANDRVLRRPVAVKVLWEGLARDPRFLTRFRREARAAASLNHPGIVSVHDTGSEAGTPFIVMEFVPGRSLGEVIASDAPLPPGRVAEIGEALASALAYAHGEGIIHRDVKPPNVMLTPSGQVKMLDFGIARAGSWTPLTATPVVHGTPEYLSPEQARGSDLDGRSDLYSVGIVLYEMLTGRPPFVGDNALAIALSQVGEQPRPPGTLNPGVPSLLSSVVMRCLAKEPDDRYSDAEELGEDLRRFRAGIPLLTPPMPLPTRVELRGTAGRRRGIARPRSTVGRRGPGRVAAAVLAVLVVLGVAGIAVSAGFGAPATTARSPARSTPPPLVPPAGLRATAECDGFMRARATLRWSPSTSPAVDGYVVYRSTSETGSYANMGEIFGRGLTTFTDEDLDQNTTYHYAVKAMGEGRSSTDAARTRTKTPFFCLL
jgi:eukaryotic-like serine/threonine-protein kinase